MKLIDWYIIRKFLGTFFLSLGLFILIVIVFDVSERIDDFIEKDAPLYEIVFSYYRNFIPYFINLFSPLFIFISVIFFTAKMANNTEIVAMLSGGISFFRILRPYMIVAAFLAGLSFYLNNFSIPKANEKRLEFEENYIRDNPYRNRAENIHRQILPGTYIYFENYNNFTNVGYKFSLETMEEGQLKYKLISDFIKWDSLNTRWRIHNYMIRTIEGEEEKIVKGKVLDTLLQFKPEEFGQRDNVVEMFDYHRLNAEIEKERFVGSEKVAFYEVEKYKRMAFPFATFVLTLIGASIASRKVRGGIGMNIMYGFLIAFSYIIMQEFGKNLALNSGVPAIISIWAPNFMYGILSVILLVKAPK